MLPPPLFPGVLCLSFLVFLTDAEGGSLQSDPRHLPGSADSRFLLGTRCLLSQGGPLHLTSLHVASSWFSEVVFFCSLLSTSLRTLLSGTHSALFFIPTSNPLPSFPSKNS